MDFIDFVYALEDVNRRVFVGYEEPDEDNKCENVAYTSIKGKNLRLPEGFQYDEESNTINSTSPESNLYNITVCNIYHVVDINADVLAFKIKELNPGALVCGDTKNNVIFCDRPLYKLSLPLGFEKRGKSLIVHGTYKYRYNQTNKYKVVDCINKYKRESMIVNAK